MPNASDFQAAQPEIHHWLMTNTETSFFARSLLKHLHSKGFLTEPQMARVRHMIICERRRHRRWANPGARSPEAERIVAMTRNPPRFSR